MKIISNGNIFNIKNCSSFKDKLCGFMFKKKKLSYGLLFHNCSLHTFFCFQNLDIIYIDNHNNILYIDKDVKPNRILFKKKNVDYIMEFSSGLLDLNHIKITN